ncbi:MAG: NAD(P)-dependent alcohol dehydrogenase, partial [Cyanobacteria bacterium P01_C01_bin.121]
GLAEYVCVSETALTLKPENMGYAEAAALPHAAMLAVQGLIDEGQLQPEQSILINGAGGGVGTLAVQIACEMGVDEITGVDCASKFDLMRSVGFTHVLDYTQTDFTQSAQHYDLIFDVKTNRSILSYLRVLNTEGTYVTVGGMTARLVQTLLLRPFIRRFTKKDVRLVDLKPNKDIAYINQLFEAGKVKPVIDGPYSLSEVPKLLQYFGEGKHKGKVVISLETNRIHP